MYIGVTLGVHEDTVVLREPDDFSTFCVVVDGDTGHAGLAHALAGIGRVDDHHAWIDAAALRSLGRPEDPNWLAKLDDMVAYARRREWVDERGAVRAHCEWGAREPRA